MRPITFLFIILTFIVGSSLHPILAEWGMTTGQEGVDYYAQVHQSKWNCWVHSVFMPLTIFGMFISIPAILGLNNQGAFRLKTIVSLLYLGFYYFLSPKVALFVFLVYVLFFHLSTLLYKKLKTRFSRISIGVLLSTIALVCQEVFGHYYGGDSPSRFEGIPNAILYATYFAISHWS